MNPIPRFALCLLLVVQFCIPPARAEFKAGAAVVDITPEKLPVLVNGGMLSRSVDKVKTAVNARALALSDGREQIVIVVADSGLGHLQRCVESVLEQTAWPNYELVMLVDAFSVEVFHVINFGKG